jgi:hypothetical protein
MSTKICSGCGKEAEKLFQCSTCQNIYYCNPKCQLDHWKIHQHLCVSPQKTSKKKNRSKINENKCFFGTLKEKEISIFVSIVHTKNAYVPGKLNFQLEIVNTSQKDVFHLDVMNSSHLLFQNFKKSPKCILPKILQQDEMLEEIEAEFDDEFDQMENPRIISINGIDIDEVSIDIKPSDHVACEFNFTVDLEFNYEVLALSQCSKFYISLNKNDEIKTYQVEIDQNEVKKYYKDFKIGCEIESDKKKYPKWIQKMKTVNNEIPSEEDWKF